MYLYMFIDIFEIYRPSDSFHVPSWKHTVTTTDLGGVFLVFLGVFCIFVCTYHILVLWGSHLWCQFWKIQLYFNCIFLRERWIVFSKIHLYFSLLYFPNLGTDAKIWQFLYYMIVEYYSGPVWAVMVQWKRFHWMGIFEKGWSGKIELVAIISKMGIFENGW
jgi:hypothetical protein